MKKRLSLIVLSLMMITLLFACGTVDDGKQE